IDQLQLLEVSHSPTATVVADQYGRAIIANELAAPVSATDQSGRNLLSAVARNDGAASKATQQRLNSIAADNLRDHIDLEFDVEPGTDDVALYLRLRNSLLNTVLFYDVMLAEQGFGALDWLGRDVNQLLNTLNVGLWYRANMGLEILVWDGEAYQSAGHLADQGPIAWSERAILLPAVGDSKTLRVRLSYVADNWRIDQVALASGAQLVESRQVNVARANAEDGALPDVPAFLAAADEQYLITRPGESISVYFDVGQADAGMARTYLLASSGYYIEWMRPEWLRAEAAAAFVANDDALLRAIRLYAERRDGYRELFETNRVMMQ
ncbi:MAG: hypothetical protein KJO82_12040, partial [Gammaproteobacteria bacterium]|nr:hypothetical protein [Gammaproteobacteria bacterium]